MAIMLQMDKTVQEPHLSYPFNASYILTSPFPALLQTTFNFGVSPCDVLRTTSVGIDLKELGGGSDVEMFEILHRD